MRPKFKITATKSCAFAALLAGTTLASSTVWAQDAAPNSPMTSATSAAAPAKQPADTDPAIDVAAEASIEESKKEDDKNWSVSATVGTHIFQGMFVDLKNQDPSLSSPNAGDPADAYERWLNVYSLGAGYKFGDFNAGARVSWSHWMTPGGGSLEPYELRFQDVNLSLGWSGVKIDAIDTQIGLSYVLTLPTSSNSQTTNLIVGNFLGVGISHTFMEKLTLAYSLSGGWTPHTTTVATVDPDIAQIYRQDEIVGNEVAVLGGYNTQFALSNSLSASFPIWDKLSASVSYTLSKYWSYAHNTDENSANIEGIQTGRNTGDSVSASFGLSYPIGKHVHLAGGISSTQRPKTADNDSFRFPWWNFSGAAANRSSINFSVTGTY